MSGKLDLNAYFARIGWAGGDIHDLASLSKLIRTHELAIPFENLDPLLGRGVMLDIESLQNKIVRERRGGYCFEHATLFGAVLSALGMTPTKRSSRVILFTPKADAPRGHMFLTVELCEGTFVVDPGFGPFAAPSAIPLVAGNTEPDPPVTHWFAHDDGYWILRMRRGSDVIDAWVSTMFADNDIDFEMANYWTANSPTSPFTSLLMMSRLTDDGRVTIMNRDYTIRRGAETLAMQLADRKELRSAVAEHFGFDLPEIETMRVSAVPEWSE